MNKIVVGIADGKIAREEDVLVSYALGSCVGICIYERYHKIAGMVHILLPYRNCSVNQHNLYKFADTGIDLLIKDMKSYGAVKPYMSAKLAGGAEMFRLEESHTGIGEANITAVKEVLLQLSIPIAAEDTGMNYGRTISFSAATGELTVKRVNGAVKVL